MDDIFSNLKIVIIGAPSVGKTSLRRCYIGETFQSNYIETIGSDFSFTTIEIESVNIGLSIWDLAGQERFLQVHPLFYKGAFGCVVVFSIVDRPTFEQVEGWVDRFLQHSVRSGLPILIIGNKLDLIDNYDDVIKEKEQEKLLEMLQNKYPGNEFNLINTSAKIGENVHEGMVNFAKRVYEWVSESTARDNVIEYEDDLDNNIPGAYLLVMNQIIGPKVIASHPDFEDNLDYYTALSNSGVKLIASLDFNDVISQSSVISSFPWINPRGLFHYIAFVIDNSHARGSNELFVLGVNINRELSEPVNGIKGVLDGLLYNSLNKFVSLMTNTEIDLTTKINEISEYPEINNGIIDILENLRKQTDESIKRWYNIPTG